MRFRPGRIVSSPSRQPPLVGLEDEPVRTDDAETLREEIAVLITGSGRRKDIAYALFGERSPVQRLSAALIGEDTYFDVDHIVPALKRCSFSARVQFVRTLLRLLDLDVAGGKIVQHVDAPVEERLADLEQRVEETDRRRERERAELRALKGKR
jgi:hypothetical protein